MLYFSLVYLFIFKEEESLRNPYHLPDALRGLAAEAHGTP